MNTQLVNTGVGARSTGRARAGRRSADVVLRAATALEAPALHALIAAHTAEGHLLPRTLEELRVHAPRFVVAVRRRKLVGCAELAPLSGSVAEVRSLVVDQRARSLGIGRRLVLELQKQARRSGYEQLCAFAHDPGFFVRRGFDIVPHTWVPEKIARDCAGCAQFRRCGQHALVFALDQGTRRTGTFVPLASLRA